jgi:apolipoprotein D and lipocalin family protein
MEPVTGFNLNKYFGTWYEIARMPARFENNLNQVTATYSLRSDGKVRVENEGVDARSQKRKRAIGKAKFAGKPDAGYLKVSFFGPFYADYVILELDQDYRYAMVASSKKCLWILSRSPSLEKTTLDSLIEKARNLGFEIEKLYYTPQDTNNK